MDDEEQRKIEQEDIDIEKKVQESEPDIDISAFSELQAEREEIIQRKDEELLDLTERLENSQQRILQLEKIIVDCKENLAVAEDKHRKLGGEN